MKRRISSPKHGSSPFKQSGTPKHVRGEPADVSEEASDSCDEYVMRDPQEILELLTTDPNLYKGNISCVPRRIPARPAEYSGLSPQVASELDPFLVRAYAAHLGNSGGENNSPDIPLFIHQCEAIEAILSSKFQNICIATSTSSGKSLAFNLPILSKILRQDFTALYLYPTKALTQDQKRVIDSIVVRRNELVLLQDPVHSTQSIECAIVDGDVKETKERAELMSSCNLILSNPDMLHHSIIPNHRKYSKYFSRLKFIVIDEAHCYDGAFGSHVASVVRRLRRVCDHYRQCSDDLPLFISCSATIGNPQEHVSRLVGVECDKLITTDGSPTGDRILTVWNSKMTSSIPDTVSIVAKFLVSKIRFICFCKNRFLIELILKNVVERLKKDMGDVRGGRIGERIVAYRAGYSPEDRRKLESRIFSGEVLGVVATSALELGMDIGSLDVAISMGYPGSIHSLWQQWGRAGRSCRPSLCMLLCREEDVVDAWISQDSDRLLEESPEDAVLQTNNPSIVKNHLICSDLELRFMTDADWDTAKAVYWGRDEVDEKVFVAAKKESPFVKKKSFSIRNIETRRISVMFENQKIDDLDIAQAFFYVHPGAVHNIQGVEYRVVDLSLPTNTATVVKASHSFFTRPSDSTTVTPVVPVVQSKGGFLHRGRVDVALKVKGFYRMSKKPPHELIDGGYEALELPAIKYATCAVWIDLAKVGIDPLLSVSAAHGASHAIFYSACQRLLLSKQSDIKCDCQNQNNSIMIFDSQNGGLGISDMIFNRLASLIHIAIGRITKCQCSEGCIKCLFLSSCSEGNRELRKTETIEFLNQLMEKVDSIHE
jgi:DEAD/DEAH box helicase domain-containing protein